MNSVSYLFSNLITNASARVTGDKSDPEFRGEFFQNHEFHGF